MAPHRRRGRQRLRRGRRVMRAPLSAGRPLNARRARPPHRSVRPHVGAENGVADGTGGGRRVVQGPVRSPHGVESGPHAAVGGRSERESRRDGSRPRLRVPGTIAPPTAAACRRPHPWVRARRAIGAAHGLRSSAGRAFPRGSGPPVGRACSRARVPSASRTRAHTPVPSADRAGRCRSASSDRRLSRRPSAPSKVPAGRSPSVPVGASPRRRCAHPAARPERAAADPRPRPSATTDRSRA